MKSAWGAVQKVLLVVLVAYLGLLPPGPVDAISLMREGDSAYQRQQYSVALEKYSAADSLGELGYLPSVRIAKVRIARGNLPSALEAVKDLERVGADEGTRLVAGGILAFRRQDYSEARQRLLEALASRPFDEEARYYLARSNMLPGEYDVALEEFGELLALPNTIASRWRQASHYNLGLIDLVRGEATAEDHLRAVESANVDLELSEKALKLLSRLQSLNEGPAQVADRLSTTGIALLSVGEARLAGELFEGAVVERPQHYEAIAYLGYLNWLQGDYARAESLLEQSIRLRPDSPLGHYFLGVLRRGQARLGEASAQFRMAIATDPESAPAYVELARTLILERDYGGAAAAFERAVEIEPDNAGYNLHLARFYLDHAIRLDQALVFAQKSVQLAPGDAEARDALGWALWANGRAYDARDNLELAIAANPDLERAHYHLAILFETLGDTQAAAREFRLAAELKPDVEFP